MIPVVIVARAQALAVPWLNSIKNRPAAVAGAEKLVLTPVVAVVRAQV